MKVIDLASILPQGRDPEPALTFVDGRFRPSFIDLGLLQETSRTLAHQHHGQEPFSSHFLADVEVMIKRYVRHVYKVKFHENGVVTFYTRDNESNFAYSFAMDEAWFEEKLED